jgi:uncharacterized protein YjeT (DUF2065 family)
MNLFLKHKVVIFRTIGILMFIINLMIYFWTTPKQELSENDRARARIERMEANLKGVAFSSGKSKEKDTSKMISHIKDSKAKQMRYFSIIAMIIGVGFLGYSFLPRKEDNS